MKKTTNKATEKNNAPLVEEKNPQGVEGGLNQVNDSQENVGKGGTPGGDKSVETTANPVEEAPAGSEAKRADNLGKGEKNLTPNSTLNVVPAKAPKKEDRSAFNCDACKGEGLEDPENPNTAICSKCQGTGKA